MKKIKDLLVKYKELLLYVFFGAGTTLVNFLAYALFQALLGERLYLLSNALAWIVAVVFAYITNKLWVLRVNPGVPRYCGGRFLRF